MNTFSLETAPPYVALSYCWGSDARVRLLEINGYRLPITKNLAEAIDTLFVFAREGKFLFWADFICIDQNDLAERSNHVRFMRKVYETADKVLVWLGPAVQDSHILPDKLAEHRKRADEWSAQTDRPSGRFWGELSRQDPLIAGAGQETARKAYMKLLQRPWWTRTWVVQEVTAKSEIDTLVCFGSHVVEFGTFKTGISIAFICEMRFPATAGVLLFLKTDQAADDTPWTLLIVLSRLLKFECQNPRDRVYAALGMATDVHDGRLIPDYTKTCAEVYVDVVRWCLTDMENGPLDFLGHVVRSTEGMRYIFPGDLPTWVPDWRCRYSETIPLPKSSKTGDDTEPENNVYRAAYNAAGGRSGPVQIQGALLHVSGAVVDRIDKVWDECWGDFDYDPSVVRSWGSKDASKEYFTGETLGSAFTHIINADFGTVVSSAGGSRGFSCHWGHVNKDPRYLTGASRSLRDIMVLWIRNAVVGRRLFETASGYIGLAPNSSQVGDEVCLFYGSQVFHIIRKKEDNHEYIGESYVHGLMDGHALTLPIVETSFTLV
jgi:hypothetical protein